MAPFDWQVPFIVVAVIGAILFLTKRSTGATKSRPTKVSSPAELMEGLQRTLGIAILVESVEVGDAGDSVVIRSTFMFGRYTTHVVATGRSESDAWEELARAAIAWRSSDYQHIPMWWGVGG